MEIDRRLRIEASRNFRQPENLRNALLWIGHNPEGFATRVIEFEDTISVINTRTFFEGGERPKRKNLVALKGSMAQNHQPLKHLSELITICDHLETSDYYGDIGKKIESLFPRLNDGILSRKWEFPHTIIDNPNKLASGLLIEGYGQLLEDMYDMPGLARQFVLAFEETLMLQDSESQLLQDVVGWMAEEKNEFSPVVRVRIEEELLPATEMEKAALRINKRFRSGGEAHEVLDDIRKFPKPIAVDFNNVIANNSLPLELNPDAPMFLEELGKIGNIFIVTFASNWEVLHDFLAQHGLWKPDMVLMTAPTYEFVSSWHRDHPKGKELRREFLTIARKMGWNYKEADLIKSPANKAVALIFGKPFKIPVIDDSSAATTSNPGMFGINVRAWRSSNEADRIQLEALSEEKPTLKEAVEIVRKHYASITIAS